MNRQQHNLSGKKQARGITLIELMIATVLGLVVVGGVTNVIVSTQHTYRANQGLAAIQENARTALELLAREIRESGSTPCGDVPVANVLNSNGANDWWGGNNHASWTQWRENGFIAYADTAAPGAPYGNAAGNRVQPPAAPEPSEDDPNPPPAAPAIASHAFQIRSTSGLSVTVANHSSGGGSSTAASQFRTDVGTTAISNGDILMVCGLEHAAAFQVSSYNAASRLIVANKGGSNPGNCTKSLTFPVNCGIADDAPAALFHTFLPGSSISHAIVTTWYIGHNGRGGTSLYRVRIGRNAEEIIPDVVDMRIQVRATDGTLELPRAAINWGNVNAVQLTLTLRSPERGVSTNTEDEGRLIREFSTVVALRNRVP